MKTNVLFALLLVPIFSWAQFTEDFSDGDFTANPAWIGTVDNFIVNSNLQLQSNAKTASTSYLFTPSKAIENAEWECFFKIDHTTSASNYACMYIISDRPSIENGLQAYFVQVGGTNDEVSLFYQNGTKKEKIIDGEDKRTDGKPVEIKVKVTRDEEAVFRLYSKLPTEADWFFEGEMLHDKAVKAKYFGLSYTNTSTTGNAYFFDDISVEGDIIRDVISPFLTDIQILPPHQLHLKFSETMTISDIDIIVNGSYPRIISVDWDEDMEGVVVGFDDEFSIGKKYQIDIENAFDEAGNYINNYTYNTGIVEDIEPDDVIFNEVMFHHHENSAEYVELYNRSGKVINLAGMYFTTQKADGSLNTGVQFPEKSLIFPQEYLAITEDTEAIKNYHACPPEANIIQTRWSALNNETATLVFTNASKEVIFDEFTYHKNRHHALVKNLKGVALERIYFDLPTQDESNWHSAAKLHNFGTPGFKNTQNKERNSLSGQHNFYLEKDYFSPDNDGIDDLCVLHYQLDKPGYIINIEILTAIGEHVYTLCHQYLANEEGFFRWDGRNKKEQTAQVGIYVFCIEIFHPEYGEKQKFKIGVALTTN